MEVGIHTFHVLQRHLLPQNHLVEGTNEECIEETAVEDGQANDTSNELEVVEMFGIDPRVRVDLKGVVVVSRILEQTVEGIEHLMGKQEEELAGETSVVQTVFTVKFDHEPLLQISSTLAHDLVVGVFEDVGTSDLDVALSGHDAECWLRSEVDQLAAEVTLVLRDILVE